MRAFIAKRSRKRRPGARKTERPEALSPGTRATCIEIFRVIAEIKAGCTPEAIRHYIVSGASSVEDVTAVSGWRGWAAWKSPVAAAILA